MFEFTGSIKSIGAGGIVRDAHLPAYKKRDLNVSGIYDLSFEKAKALANDFKIEHVYSSLQELVATSCFNDIFDVAVPANAIETILKALPDGSAVLIQKPMGESFEQASEIVRICKQKKLRAGVNFQLRYAPYITQVKEIIQKGLIGDITDVEVRLNVNTPWHLWDFFTQIPRTEILYHSIHYIDLIRSLLGDPVKVYAKTWKHPQMMEIASTRSILFFDFEKPIRVHINTNHAHYFGADQQECFLKIEGTTGALKLKMGVYYDYPKGVPDELSFISLNNSTPVWQQVEITGTWFYDAFGVCMDSFIDYSMDIQRSNIKFTSTIDDALKTMAVVEAAYLSNDLGGVLPLYAQEL
jgi:predicted dehydrogenase